MSAILITGGDGDIARAIQKALQNAYPKRPVLGFGRKILDVTNEESVAAGLFYTKPHILINCAGYIKPQDVEDSDPAAWKKELDINLYGAYLCSKYALEHGCPMIINIGSSASRKGKAGWSGYCASKAGLVSLTESLAAEGVKALCISPGRTATKMRKGLFPDEPVEPLMTPEEFAEVVVDAVRGEFKWGTEVHVSKQNGEIEIKW